jgi:hypothetical protein
MGNGYETWILCAGMLNMIFLGLFSVSLTIFLPLNSWLNAANRVNFRTKIVVGKVAGGMAIAK